MKAEFLDLTRKGIKPVLIIDELQALDKVYLDNEKERQLITEKYDRGLCGETGKRRY